MNKQKFVDFLRRPHNISDKDLEEIQNTIEEFPYFQSARTVIAKASKIKSLPSAKAEITRASIYATDRAHLKKYIVGDLIFLKPLDVHDSHEGEKKSRNIGSIDIESTKAAVPTEKKQEIAHDVDLSTETHPKESTSTESVPSAQVETDSPKTAIDVSVSNDSSFQQANITDEKSVQEREITIEDSVTPKDQDDSLIITEKPESDLDHLIEDIFSDIKELKINRARFEELEKKIEEEDAVNDAVEKATKKAQENPASGSKINTENQEEPVQKKNDEQEETTKELTEQEETIEAKKQEEPSAISQDENVSELIDETNQQNQASSEEVAQDLKESEEQDSAGNTNSENEERPTRAKRVLTRKRAAKKVTPKKIDTHTTSNKKVVKGESAIEKAAAKMRASGKIMEQPSTPSPEVSKRDTIVNNTPPEKIIKTYIRKRSSERVVKAKNDTDSKETNGEKEDHPDPSGYSDPNQIIENFIQTQPSITPNKENEAISLGDLSELSTVFNPEVASEYLAEIFLEQGKIDKAISIYEQLILKFPDKSTYFADIIKKLKD